MGRELASHLRLKFEKKWAPVLVPISVVLVPEIALTR